MKLGRLADIATIGSAIIVVITLILLVIEVRSNTEAVRASSYQDIIAKSSEHLLILATDSELTEIVMKGYGGAFDSLDATQQTRFFFYTRVVWRNFENAFIQRSHGVLDDTEWEVYSDLMCSQYYRFPEYWEIAHKPRLAQPFVDLIHACPNDA